LQVALVVSAAECSRVDVVNVTGPVVALVDHADIVIVQVAQPEALPCRVIATLRAGGAAGGMGRAAVRAGNDQLGTTGL
jgi:hypothetical protein